MNQVYNVAYGARTTLNELFALIRQHAGVSEQITPVYRDFRAGDVRHSLASIAKAERLLGYAPSHSVAQGLAEAATWYCQCFAA